MLCTLKQTLLFWMHCNCFFKSKWQAWNQHRLNMVALLKTHRATVLCHYMQHTHGFQTVIRCCWLFLYRKNLLSSLYAQRLQRLSLSRSLSSICKSSSIAVRPRLPFTCCIPGIRFYLLDGRTCLLDRDGGYRNRLELNSGYSKCSWKHHSLQVSYHGLMSHCCLGQTTFLFLYASNILSEIK